MYDNHVKLGHTVLSWQGWTYCYECDGMGTIGTPVDIPVEELQARMSVAIGTFLERMGR